MINAVSNYEKTKLSMANVFLQYDQDTMIAKFSLKHDPSWLYLSFVKRIYRINRKSGNVQWSEDDFKTVCEADYNEAIRLRPDFSDAYFNRGLVYVFLGETQKGIADLSKAGELGIVSAYNVIKRLGD